MKDILVNYTRQEQQSTGMYKRVEYQGFIQHWDCGEHHTLAIILNTKGQFHIIPISDIWVDKSNIPEGLK